MVIGVVGWGSVWDGRCGNWGGRGTSPFNDAIDMFCGGEYLCSGTVIGVVYSFPSTIDPDIRLLFINLPEDHWPLCFCSSPVAVILIESLLINGASRWLPPSPGNDKPCMCCWSVSGLKLWGRLSCCDWGSRRLLGDLYRLIPANGRVVGVDWLCLIELGQVPVWLTGSSVWVSLTREKGR